MFLEKLRDIYFKYSKASSVLKEISLSIRDTFEVRSGSHLSRPFEIQIFAEKNRA